jgi:hypothetical protein
MLRILDEALFMCKQQRSDTRSMELRGGLLMGYCQAVTAMKI